jgi:phosphonate dehydrogenase
VRGAAGRRAGRPLVVVTHRVHPEVVRLLRRRARVRTNDGEGTLPPAVLRARSRDADAILAFMPDRIDAALLDACPRLRIVAGAFKGTDNVDLGACARRGVRVSAVPDLLTEPTADLAVALLLALTRRVLEGDRAVRARGRVSWRPALYGAGLAGSRVGIVGFGAVGRAVARRLAAFGARIRFADPSAAGEDGVRRAPLGRLLADSDAIVLAAPLRPDTLHLLDRRTLARARPGAYLVNVGRGSVVDEEAVAAALASGRLAGYAADVFEMEDLSRPDRPRRIPPALLAQRDRTVLTPHLGSAVAAVRLAVERAAAANVLDVLAGRPPRDAVDRPPPPGR